MSIQHHHNLYLKDQIGLLGFPIFWLLSKLSIDLQNTIICDKLVFRKEIIIIDSSMEYSRNISYNIWDETTLNNSVIFYHFQIV